MDDYGVIIIATKKSQKKINNFVHSISTLVYK